MNMLLMAIDAVDRLCLTLGRFASAPRVAGKDPPRLFRSICSRIFMTSLLPLQIKSGGPDERSNLLITVGKRPIAFELHEGGEDAPTY